MVCGAIIRKGLIMCICWNCYWGWPKPIRDIYDEALAKLDGNDLPLRFGPAHIVWEDENFDCAQICLDEFEPYASELTEYEKEIVRWSLERLLEVPEEFKEWPDDYDGKQPENFPPPDHWQCKQPR